MPENVVESVDSARLSGAEMRWKARIAWVSVLWRRLLGRRVCFVGVCFVGVRLVGVQTTCVHCPREHPASTRVLQQIHVDLRRFLHRPARTLLFQEFVRPIHRRFTRLNPLDRELPVQLGRHEFTPSLAVVPIHRVGHRIDENARLVVCCRHGLHPGDLEDRPPFLRQDRLDGETRPTLEEHHVLQSRHRHQCVPLDPRVKGADPLNIDHVPTGIVGVAARVVVLVFRVKRRVVRISLLGDLGDARDRERLRVGVVVQDPIALLDVIAEEVSSLVVADTVPVRLALGSPHQVVKREHVGLGLEQPESSGIGQLGHAQSIGSDSRRDKLGSASGSGRTTGPRRRIHPPATDPTTMSDPFSAKATLQAADQSLTYFSLQALDKAGIGSMQRLPFSIRVLLESALRNLDEYIVKSDDVRALANWGPENAGSAEIPFMPSRVVLQDFTGVPCVVDLAAMRAAMHRLGGDPKKINPLVPCDLVIDHSVQVDYFGSKDALAKNVAREFERNKERYEFLKWGQQSFTNFRAVPPDTGIVHQVNLEYLAGVALTKNVDGELQVFPDSVVGTDSHTTMINGLGVLGWGVGGIEAEAVMLGQPIYMLMPEVVGFELKGALPEGATATDMVLRVVEMLREQGVVGKFVEFYGDGARNMTLADRATIANMAPEYGATMGFFPVDAETIRYLRLTGRPEAQVAMVEAYYRRRVCSSPTTRRRQSSRRLSRSICRLSSPPSQARSARKTGSH